MADITENTGIRTTLKGAAAVVVVIATAVWTWQNLKAELAGVKSQLGDTTWKIQRLEDALRDDRARAVRRMDTLPVILACDRDPRKGPARCSMTIVEAHQP